jgi:hypothetical protein
MGCGLLGLDAQVPGVLSRCCTIVEVFFFFFFFLRDLQGVTSQCSRRTSKLSSIDSKAGKKSCQGGNVSGVDSRWCPPRGWGHLCRSAFKVAIRYYGSTPRSLYNRLLHQVLLADIFRSLRIELGVALPRELESPLTYQR